MAAVAVPPPPAPALDLIGNACTATSAVIGGKGLPGCGEEAYEAAAFKLTGLAQELAQVLREVQGRLDRDRCQLREQWEQVYRAQGTAGGGISIVGGTTMGEEIKTSGAPLCQKQQQETLATEAPAARLIAPSGKVIDTTSAVPSTVPSPAKGKAPPLGVGPAPPPAIRLPSTDVIAPPPALPAQAQPPPATPLPSASTVAPPPPKAVASAPPGPRSILKKAPLVEDASLSSASVEPEKKECVSVAPGPSSATSADVGPARADAEAAPLSTGMLSVPKPPPPGCGEARTKAPPPGATALLAKKAPVPMTGGIEEAATEPARGDAARASVPKPPPPGHEAPPPASVSGARPGKAPPPGQGPQPGPQKAGESSVPTAGFKAPPPGGALGKAPPPGITASSSACPVKAPPQMMGAEGVAAAREPVVKALPVKIDSLPVGVESDRPPAKAFPGSGPPPPRPATKALPGTPPRPGSSGTEELRAPPPSRPTPGVGKAPPAGITVKAPPAAAADVPAKAPPAATPAAAPGWESWKPTRSTAAEAPIPVKAPPRGYPGEIAPPSSKGAQGSTTPAAPRDNKEAVVTYSGRIKSFNAETGFGFIECAETAAQYGRDVFLHKNQVGELQVDQKVTFSVEVKGNKPQAKDVEAAGPPPAPKAQPSAAKATPPPPPAPSRGTAATEEQPIGADTDDATGVKDEACAATPDAASGDRELETPPPPPAGQPRAAKAPPPPPPALPSKEGKAAEDRENLPEQPATQSCDADSNVDADAGVNHKAAAPPPPEGQPPRTAKAPPPPPPPLPSREAAEGGDEETEQAATQSHAIDADRDAKEWLGTAPVASEGDDRQEAPRSPEEQPCEDTASPAAPSSEREEAAEGEAEEQHIMETTESRDTDLSAEEHALAEDSLPADRSFIDDEQELSAAFASEPNRD